MRLDPTGTLRDRKHASAPGWLRAALLYFFLLAAGALQAQTAQVFAVDGVAIRGYDPVAYFEGAPAAGSDAFSHEWKGARWKFSSERNLQRFIADPERYAPQFGGFCALGMAHGGAVPTDPTAFTVHAGKLYLNASHPVRETWAYDPDWMIERAMPKWAALQAPQPASAARQQQPQQGSPADGPAAGAADAQAPLALDGLDPVSYADPAGPVAGREDLSVVWSGRTWRFSDQRHRAMFESEPHHYAPQYDGHSALIVAHGGLVPGNPRLYTVVDGRLYLEIGPPPRETWRRNAQRLIERADRQWPALKAGAGR